jgi:2-phospho-L-lactate guanylyltransferase
VTWALVPCKGFQRGKSRLAAVLPATERAQLSRQWFEHVLVVLRESAGVAGVLVVTENDEVAEVAAARGASVHMAEPAAGLNGLVDGGLAALAQRGAARALVLMADLPRLQSRDVEDLLALLGDRELVVAPDAREQGTNALALRPPDRIRTCFGSPDSFARHLAAAEDAGLRAAIHRSSRLAFDVDDPEDLARLAGL